MSTRLQLVVNYNLRINALSDRSIFLYRVFFRTLPALLENPTNAWNSQAQNMRDELLFQAQYLFKLINFHSSQT